MTADRPHVLLLAGTHEARVVARKLQATLPNIRLTVSFAGAISSIPDIGVDTRVGGFGGVSGLAKYLENENVTLVIDATHPFAAQMSRNAHDAARRHGVKLLRLLRPEWPRHEGDQWVCVGSVEEAAAQIPKNARAFLAIGRKDIAMFYDRTDIYALARMIEPPPTPFPKTWDVLLGRPSDDVVDEQRLLENSQVSIVVTKNSGGAGAHAKIEAARRLSIPVLMVTRPKLPAADTGADPEEIIRLTKSWFTRHEP